MNRNRYSKSREAEIDKANESLFKAIKRIQSDFIEAIKERVNELDRDGDTIKDSISNISKIAQINKLYRDFIADQGNKLVDPLISGMESIHTEGVKYFEDITKKKVNPDRSKKSTFKAFGWDITANKIIAGGIIHGLLVDESPVNRLKSYLINTLKGSTTVKDIISKFNRVGKGFKDRPGIFEKHILEKLPQPFERFDRANGVFIATDLQLNYAIYQGGVIRDSRPFCVERNNKVFSREEIQKFGTSSDKFGGYTNKSAGEFQGKPPLYDPLIDLGGYNCRHVIDWISDDLAFVLRPDLKP